MEGTTALLGVLAPVAALIALGSLLARVGILDEAGRASCSRLLYWVALPILLAVKLSEQDPSTLEVGSAALAGLGVFVLGNLCCLALTRGMDAAERGAVLMGVGRFNGAFIGLPVILLLDASRPSGESLMPQYLVLLALMAPATNVMGVVGVLVPLHGWDRHGMRRLALELLRNPILWACILGIVLGSWRPGSLSGGSLGNTLGLLAQAAIPLALLGCGAAINLGRCRRRATLLGLVALARLVLMPVATWVAAVALGAPPAATTAMVILMACPTAMSAVPLARELGADESLTAACVAITTLFALPSLLLWLILLS